MRRPVVGHRDLIVCLLCAAYAISCWLQRPVEPITTPDSAAYLTFAPFRALGYPVFLRLLGGNGAIVAQPILFAAALAWLGLESLHLTSSIVLAVTVIAAALTTPDLKTYHFSLLTESLFTSGVVALLAAMTRCTRVPSRRVAALAATIAGVMGTIRRTGVALAIVPVILIVMCWRRLPGSGWSIVAAVIIPPVAVLAAEGVTERVVHGDRLTTIIGRQLYAKAAMIDAPPVVHPSADPLDRRLEQHLDVDFAPVRALVARAPRELHVVLTLFYETCLQWQCVPELQGPVAVSTLPLNDGLRKVSVDRIARAPGQFALLTATHYRALWTAYHLRHPAVASALTAFLAANRPLPLEREVFAVGPDQPLVFSGDRKVVYLQPAVFLIGWITGALAILGLAAAATRRLLSPPLTIACLASLTAHLGLLFSALFAAGIARFTVSVWPAIMTAVVFAAWATVRATDVLPRRTQSPQRIL